MTNCDKCKAGDTSYVSRASFESVCLYFKEINKRLSAIIVLLIILLVGTNLAWLYYESQFQDVVQEVTQDAENGTNNFIGGDFNGETDSTND